MISPMRRYDIYARLWRAAAPHDSTSGTARAGQTCAGFDFERRMLRHPLAALKELRKLFFGWELIAAGVARRGHDGAVIPAPALDAEEVELVALLRQRDEPPRELLTPAGCVRITSLQAMLDDYRLRARLRDAHGYVYLALAWDDWLWLDALGLPALYCANLDELDALQFLRIHSRLKSYAGRRGRPKAAPADRFKDPAPKDPAPKDPAAAAKLGQADAPPAATASTKAAQAPAAPKAGAPRAAPDDSAQKAPSRQLAPQRSPATPAEAECADAIRAKANGARSAAVDESPKRASPPAAVVIMAWSPSAGCHDWPAGLEAQLAGLAQAQVTLGDRLPELLVWTPDAAAQTALSLAARCGDIRRLREAIVDSVETSARVPAAACAAIRPVSYIAARAAYHEALEQQARGLIDSHELIALQEAYKNCLERELIEPLLGRAQKCTVPQQRAIHFVTAELLSEFLRKAQRTAAEPNRPGGRGSAAGVDHMAGFLREGMTLIKMLAAAGKLE